MTFLSFNSTTKRRITFAAMLGQVGVQESTSMYVEYVSSVYKAGAVNLDVLPSGRPGRPVVDHAGKGAKGGRGGVFMEGEDNGGISGSSPDTMKPPLRY